MQTIQLIITGVAQGCVYGLVALGFVLIYKATEAVSFAQGELMMLGAFAGLGFMTLMSMPYWIAIPASLLAAGIFGLVLERTIVRPLLGQPVFAMVMLTIGIGYVARGGVTMIPDIGTDTHALSLPYVGTVWKYGELVLDVTQIVVIATTAALSLLLYLMFRYTRIGIAMQAASQNQLAAYYVGIPVQTLNGIAWALAAAIAALAGILLAPITFVHANMGFVGLKAFPAAVVGGFGSLPGAVAGGVVIGLMESFAGFYLPEGFKDAVPYVVVLLMLAIRPNGLFGESLRKKV